MLSEHPGELKPPAPQKSWARLRGLSTLKPLAPSFGLRVCSHRLNLVVQVGGHEVWVYLDCFAHHVNDKCIQPCTPRNT